MVSDSRQGDPATGSSVSITPSPVRIIETDGGLAELNAEAFIFSRRPSPLAIAFISPHLDFVAITETLRRLGGATPVLAISTAGELCSTGAPASLYKPTGDNWSTVVVQIFSPDLLASVSIYAIPLHNDDIRRGSPTMSREERVDRIAQSLASAVPPFRLDARDSLALTFVDGVSACENYLMEAVYRTGKFPCLFVGGSAGGKLDFKNTYLFDGCQVVENHAVIAFIKLAPGKRYGVLKSQNFRKTGTSVIVVDADPDRRTVATVLDPITGEVIPIIDALSTIMGVSPAAVMDRLTGHTFGIELDGELFVRSVATVELETGLVTFYCDINQGDELLLLQATDFAEQTKQDIETFLSGKPPPLAALLNDCILRRINNEASLSKLSGMWKAPVAGFSTFGELLGININQTLTAVAFFDDSDGKFSDDFVDTFPVHYARFCNYFTRRHLNRIEILNRLRLGMTQRLATHFGASMEMVRGIEGLMTQTSDVRTTMESIRATVARESATEERARQAERQLADAIETISEGFALYDKDDRLVICNSQYREIFGGDGKTIPPGSTFTEIANAGAERGIYGYEGEALDRFLVARIAEHGRGAGKGVLHPMANGRWMVSKEYRTSDGGIVATRTDVTELKLREQEIEALKRRYELILVAAGDGIIGIAADGIVTFANRAAAHILSMRREKLEGVDYRVVLCGSDSACQIPDLSRSTVSPEAGEGVFARNDGSYFPAEYILAPIHENHAFQGAVLVFRDVSLRRRYEESLANQQRELERQVAERTQTLSAEVKRRALTEHALTMSQGRLKGITASLFEGVLLVDGNGHIVFANRSAHRLLHAEADQLPGTELSEALQILRDGQILPFQMTPFPTVIETGETVVEEDAVFVIKGGLRLSVAYASSALEEEGKRRAAIISFRSIEALKEAQRDAMQSSRLASVGQLAAGIAHEINTPIQYVGDNLRFIQESFVSIDRAFKGVRTGLLDIEAGTSFLEAASKMRQLFDDCELDYLLQELPVATTQSLEGVNRVSHIVRSMKEFSHPGSVAKAATDINRAINSTITVSTGEWKHVAKVETDLAADLPPIVCFPADVNQVLLNLIVNAAHSIEGSKPATPGIIRVSSRLDGAFIEIRVSDNGPGVPQAVRDRIFDPFFTTKEVGKGTGQGLSISFDVIVNKHGGKIFLDEGGDKGATFVVRLPVGVIV
jgi:PAS domain S-box-containing protein